MKAAALNTYTHTLTLTRTHSHTHIHTHTHIIYIHYLLHLHTHVYTHTQTPPPSPPPHLEEVLLDKGLVVLREAVFRKGVAAVEEDVHDEVRVGGKFDGDVAVS
jgi:hypothetical protein